MTEESKYSDDHYYDDEEIDDVRGGGTYVKKPKAHHHTCEKCGCRYKHKHNMSTSAQQHESNQFDHQCPNTDCVWYFGKGDKKQKLNLTESTLCKALPVGGFITQSLSNSFGQWTYDAAADYGNYVVLPDVPIADRDLYRGQLKNELRFTAMIKNCKEGTIVVYVGSHPSYYLKTAMLYNSDVLVICIDPSNRTSTLPNTHKFQDNGVYFFKGRAEMFITQHILRLKQSLRKVVYYSDLRSTDKYGEMTFVTLAKDISTNCLMIKTLPRLVYYEYKFSVGPAFKDYKVFMPAQFVRDTVWDRQNGNELLAFGTDKTMQRPDFSHMRQFKYTCNENYVEKQNGRVFHLAYALDIHELANRMILNVGPRESYSPICKCNAQMDREKICAKCTLVLDTMHHFSAEKIAHIWDKYRLHVVPHSRKYYGAHPTERTGREIRTRTLYKCIPKEKVMKRVDDVFGSVKRFGKFPVNIIRPKITSNDHDMWKQYGGHPRMCSCDPLNHTCNLDNDEPRTSMVIDVNWMEQLDYLKLARKGDVYVTTNLFGLDGTTKGQLGQCEWEVVHRGDENYVLFDPKDSEPYCDPQQLWWNDCKYYHEPTGELLKWIFLNNDFYGDKELGIPPKSLIKMWISTPGKFERQAKVVLKKIVMPTIGVIGKLLGRFKEHPEHTHLLVTRSVVNSGMELIAKRKHVEFAQASLSSAPNITAPLIARTASKLYKLLSDEMEMTPEQRGYAGTDNKIYYVAELVQYCAAAMKMLRSAAYVSQHNANIDLLYDYASGKSMNNILTITMLSFRMIMIVFAVCFSLSIVLTRWLHEDTTKIMVTGLILLYVFLAIGEMAANALGPFHWLSWYVNTVLYKVNGYNYDIHLHYMKAIAQNKSRLHGKTLSVMAHNANYDNKTNKPLMDTEDCVKDNMTDYTNKTSICIWWIGVILNLFVVFEVYIYFWHGLMAYEVVRVDDEYRYVMMLGTFGFSLFVFVWNAFNWYSFRPKKDDRGNYGVSFFKSFLQQNSDTLSDDDIKKLLNDIRKDVISREKLRDLYDYFVLSLPSRFSCSNGLMNIRRHAVSTFVNSRNKFKTNRSWYRCAKDVLCCCRKERPERMMFEMLEMGNEKEEQSQVSHYLSRLKATKLNVNGWFSCCDKEPTLMFEEILERYCAKVESCNGYSSHVSAESDDSDECQQESKPGDVVLQIAETQATRIRATRIRDADMDLNESDDDVIKGNETLGGVERKKRGGIEASMASSKLLE